MEEIVSYCGLVCISCPIFIATNETDAELKAKMKTEIAKSCNRLYQTEFSPEDITDCDGCLSESGRHFLSCADCKIRNCAHIHKVSNCAHCEDYACDTLKEFFKDNQESKSRLDFIRAIL